MEDYKKALINIGIIYVNLLFSIILMRKCLKIEGFSYIFFTKAFLIGAFIYLIYTVLSTKNFYNILMLLILFGIFCLWIYNNEKYIFMTIYKNIEYIKILNKHIYEGNSTYFYQYKDIVSIVIPLITIILLFISNYYKNFIIVFSILPTVFFWHYDYKKTVISVTPYLLALNILTYFINQNLNIKNKGKKQNIKIYRNKYITLFYIIFLSSTIPFLTNYIAKNINISNANLRNKILDKVLNNTKNINESYSLNKSGYTNTEKKLGGPIDIDNNEAFKVKSDKSYYLRGCIKDYYDGFSWKTSKDTFKRLDKYKQELQPNNNSFFSIRGEGTKNSISIIPTNISTSTLFAPINTYDLNHNNKIYFNRDKSFISSNNISSEYIIKFYDDNYKYSILSNKIKEKEDFFINMIDFEYKRTKSLYPSKIDGYEDYLQLSENIPKRVYDLTKDITKDANTLGEKVFRIYEYLNKNYEYSLDVKDIPEGQEFVEHFLFNEKKGYCTYFATSATIMLRIIGIPTRYVEGFNMGHHKDDKGRYVVYNRNAHAWCEILVSPYSDTWTIIDTVPEAPEMINQIMKSKEESRESFSEIEYENDNDHNDIEELHDNIKKEHKVNKQIDKVNYKKYILLLVIIFLIILIPMKIIIELKKVEKILKSSKSVFLYEYTLKRLETINIYKNSKGEYEFLEQIEEEKLKHMLKILTNASCKEFYGEVKEQQLNFNEKKEIYTFIENTIKKRLGKFRYYIYKYL
ncbi:transglutaminase domain-containing protein [Clostridium cochlearium]|uniref:transglutaminase domain-containing protein n=1 Tax=Clostridium cochlearium TaxID=1494 RepID=UPI001EDCBC02|nr:transglutaminase domain-containing protein [Clostridium cochlearium]MCG4579049.1 transglutaminase domain-containing protein [Clostridium cochlearium]